MIEALNNPHYKKIWEKVIMNRHPEAKSLEEALKLELKYDFCLQYQKNLHNTAVGNDIGFVKESQIAIIHLLQKAGKEASDDIVFDILQKYIKENNVQILGRPITLEDIFLLSSRAYSYDEGYVAMSNLLGLPIIFEWKLTKPLHEQSEETWKSIYKIMTSSIEHILTVDELPQQTHGN